MSSSVNREGGIVPKVATVALTQGQLVKVNGAEVTVCTASDRPFGVATEKAEAGEQASIATFAVNGTVLLEASAAIAFGATVKPAAAGRVTTATTGLLVAYALEAATGAGDRFEAALLTPVTVS
jgi:hypothetical protein